MSAYEFKFPFYFYGLNQWTTYT